MGCFHWIKGGQHIFNIIVVKHHVWVLVELRSHLDIFHFLKDIRYPLMIEKIPTYFHSNRSPLFDPLEHLNSIFTLDFDKFDSP